MRETKKEGREVGEGGSKGLANQFSFRGKAEVSRVSFEYW